jgi:hypothetical protein
MICIRQREVASVPPAETVLIRPPAPGMLSPRLSPPEKVKMGVGVSMPPSEVMVPKVAPTEDVRKYTSPVEKRLASAGEIVIVVPAELMALACSAMGVKLGSVSNMEMRSVSNGFARTIVAGLVPGIAVFAGTSLSDCRSGRLTMLGVAGSVTGFTAR